jgi:hypothetical protein
MFRLDGGVLESYHRFTMNVSGLGSMLETVIAISDVELMCISETSGLD